MRRPGKIASRIGSPGRRRQGYTAAKNVGSSSTGVFIGPSVDGSDKEYIKIISGKVDDRKPSFAR